MQIASNAADVAGVAAALESLWQKAAPASGGDDVDWYANAVAGRTLRPAALDAIRSDVAAAREAFYRSLVDAVRRRLS